MATASMNNESARTKADQQHRTGPVGRLARLGLAGVFALALLSIVGPQWSARFRNPHILGEASAWFLHLMMVLIFVILVGALASALAGAQVRRRWQGAAIVVLVATVVVAAGVGYLLHRSAWGFLLADIVWWFDALVLGEQVGAFLLAVVLGTPGCEIGVWGDLIARARGGPARMEDGLACIVGLHLLDRWEAQ